MTLSELIETLELIKYEQGGDPETGLDSVWWDGDSLVVSPQPVGQEQLFKLLHGRSGCACDGTEAWASDSPPHLKHIQHYNDLTDAVLALLAGEQEQVESPE